MELLEKKDKSLITWLIINLLLVVLIIIVGGLTRLTDSGLSITEWNYLLDPTTFKSNKLELLFQSL